MPGDEKTLRDTIAEAAKQTQESSQDKVVETKEGISDGDKGDTQSGGTPEFVGGVDISDIPEQDRPRIKELLSKKMSLVDKGAQEKFREVASEKKRYENLIAELEQHKAATQTATQQAKASKLLDKLSDQVPAEQRQSLEQLRQIINEETNVTELQKQVKDLTDAINRLQGDTVDTKRSKVESDLSSMDEKYGKELIDKYREDIIKAGVQYKAPIRQLIHAIVPADELEQAILEKSKKGEKKVLTPEKKQAISSNPASISKEQKIDTKQSMRDMLREMVGKK